MSQATSLNRKKTFWQMLFSQRQLVLMSLPFVLYIILFKFVPLWGWTMAFQNYKPAKGFFDQQWVGLAKFAFLFKDKEFLLSLRNTIGMSLISTALGFITAILIAVFLNEVQFIGIKRFTQTVSYLPHFLS
ncbi:MAG: sugar ABC transporter permease, partial [Treponema sp.]|nr:sugar ABC transporter permease [Treponema sp.]